MKAACFCSIGFVFDVFPSVHYSLAAPKVDAGKCQVVQALFAAQTFQNKVDVLLGRILFTRRPGIALATFLAICFAELECRLIFALVNATMSQTHSLFLIRHICLMNANGE